MYLFVRNSFTKSPEIQNHENIIIVPNAKDSVDIVIILMMTNTAINSDKNALIFIESGDKIFVKAKRNILINQEYNQNVNIIKPCFNV